MSRFSRPQRRSFQPAIENLEERVLLSASGDTFVTAVYRDLDLGTPDDAALARWSGALDRGSPADQVVKSITDTPQYRTKQVEQMFHDLTGRPPGPRQVRRAVKFLAKGGSLEQLQARLLGSESYARQPGQRSDLGFLRGLFGDVLHRRLDPESAAGLGRALANGTSRERLALLVLNSPGAHRQLVRGLYQQFLGASPEQRLLRAHVIALKAGASREQIIARVLGSDQYRSRLSIPTTLPADDKLAPTVTIASPTAGLITKRNVRVEGQVIDDKSGVATVQAQVDDGSFFDVSLDAAGGFGFDTTLALDGTAEGDHAVRLRAADRAGNVSPLTGVIFRLDTLNPAVGTAPLDMTVATTIGDATRFLYTGPDAVQTGVAPDTIKVEHAAVLRGRVTDRDGVPLRDVLVTVPGHAEFGQTRTRADGMFDLAVNGGDTLTVNYSRDGYLTAQRQIEVPWQDYSWLPDVVLVALDTQVTTIDLTAAAPIQVARGSAVTDADGSRQATLLFGQGTTARMEFSGGGSLPLSTLHVRATEYTVGENGLEAMPGELPPTSGYTYAVELSVDEAMAAGAAHVVFNQAVPFYVENFLDFPVGGIVPAGYYDRQLAAWVPSDNGRVIEVLAATGGMADLDIDGDALPDDATELAALGITDAERAQLAGLYAAGQELWRVPISHFTPWDCNWPYGPPDDATPPGQPAPEQNQNVGCPEQIPGSIIDVHNQVLGERVGVAGTPFSLNYRSDRVPGRLQDKNSLAITLSGPTVPASLRGIELEILIAGLRIARRNFPAAPDQSFQYTWDGVDGFGRRVQGEQPVTVRIGYRYGAVRYQEPADFFRSFGRVSGGGTIAGDSERNELTVWQEFKTTLGGWDARAYAPGAWTLDVHHTYDPVGKVLYLGGGSQRSERGLPHAMASPVPTNVRGASGLVATADGGLFITDTFRHEIVRVASDGTNTVVAGNGFNGFNGDGEATQTRFSFPSGLVAGPGGSYEVTFIDEVGTPRTRLVNRPILFVADFGNNRIRELRPSGDFLFVHTIGGTGVAGFSGDEGPALFAQLNRPSALVAAPDGSLYIADTGNNRIRKVGPDGIITTVAGNGTAGFGGDDGPATQAQLNQPFGLTLAPDGTLYIADTNNRRIRKVDTQGVITTVAGGGTGFPGDGTRAPEAQFANTTSVVWSPADSSLFLAEGGRVHRVGTDGFLRAVPQLDGVSATLLSLAQGGQLIASGSGGTFAIKSSFTGFSGQDVTIASKDGSEVYRFNANGRHLQTLDAITGATLYSFAYDAAGRLSTVTDGDTNVTTLERDAGGNPTAIVAPFGQRTTLSVDANGYLASIANPAGAALQFTYSADGLMQTETDPEGGVHRFFYDANNLGRLIRDEGPDGGFTTLTRVADADVSDVIVTDALNRVTTYRMEAMPNGDRMRVSTLPDGTQITDVYRKDGTRTVTFADGTVVTAVQGPDPRWGMQSPRITSMTTATPGGLVTEVAMTRTATLADATDPLSLQTLTDTVTVNGRTYTSTFDAVAMRLTVSSPEGRQAAATLDARGRVIEGLFAGLDPFAFAYDARGRLEGVTQGAGAATRTGTLTYDERANVASFTDPLTRTVSYESDAVGQITVTTLPDGEQVRLAYDADGNVNSITPPGRPAYIFTHTPGGQLETSTGPDVGPGDEQTRYFYNLDAQLSRLERPDGSALDLGYSDGGRFSRLTFPGGELRYDYDAATGAVTSITAPDGGTLSFTRDGFLLTGVAWGGVVQGNVGHTYNNDFKVASESVNGGSTVIFGYDRDLLLTQAGALQLDRNAQNGLVTGTTLGDLRTDLRYNTLGEGEGQDAAWNAATVYTSQYARDALGRIRQKTETVGGATVVEDYTYDPAGRLWEVRRDGVLAATYTYDGNDNQLSQTTPGGTVTARYDAQDRLLEYGDTIYTYTLNGERASATAGGQTTTYDYDALGNLRQVTLPGGPRIEYLTDGTGRRIGKQINGTLVQGFLYGDALDPVAELDGNNQIVSRFVYGTRGGVPDYMERGGRTYRIIADHLGSVRLVIDVANGAVAQQIDYDEFGNVVRDTNSGFQPFGFAGGLRDGDTGLTRFGLRDYDARTGRWTTQDPIGFAGGDTNLYGYAGGDPVNNADPTGLRTPSVPPGLPKRGLGRRFLDRAKKEFDDFCENPEEYIEEIKKPIDDFFTWKDRAEKADKSRERLEQVEEDDDLDLGNKGAEWLKEMLDWFEELPLPFDDVIPFEEAKETLEEGQNGQNPFDVGQGRQDQLRQAEGLGL